MPALLRMHGTYAPLTMDVVFGRAVCQVVIAFCSSIHIRNGRLQPIRHRDRLLCISIYYYYRQGDTCAWNVNLFEFYIINLTCVCVCILSACRFSNRVCDARAFPYSDRRQKQFCRPYQSQAILWYSKLCRDVVSTSVARCQTTNENIANWILCFCFDSQL